jgi:hypothetical protein
VSRSFGKRRSALARWRKWAACAALLAFAVPALRLAAQGSNSLPAAWSHWKYFRAINLPPTAVEQLAAVRVPPEVFAHAQRNLGDLRIIDDRDAEVPYLLNIASGTERMQMLAARQLELSYVARTYTQAVFDVGAQAPFHNSIDIHTTLMNFIAWAQLKISDDAREWRRTGGLQPIYAFSNKGVNGTGTLTYPQTNARYIRVRIYDRAEKFPLTGVTVAYTTHVPEERVGFGSAEARASLSQQNQKTEWRADFGYALPLDSVRIDSSSQEFYRRVETYTSDDQKDWDLVGAGEIYRFYARPPADAAPIAPAASADRGVHVQNSVSFDAHSARYWRVDVDNGNDAPLADAQLQFSMTDRRIVFRQEPQRSYSLLYGESQINTTPRYDLGEVLNVAQIRDAHAAANIGPEETNASWSDPRPWSERNAAALWVAVILAALALAFVAFQSLKSAAGAESRGDSSSRRSDSL